MQAITNLFEKRLVDYLFDGAKVLVLFDWHGMGDCVMFMPLYKRLKQLYPNVHFNLKCNNGQEYFEEIDCDDFDFSFNVEFCEFNMSKYGFVFEGLSKPEICAIYELGIPFDESLEFTWKPDKIIDSEIKLPQNAIGVAFQVTSNPTKSISEDCARVVWDTIKECGYTPIEVHFEHCIKNDRNKKYSFIDLTCRDFEAKIENVVDVISKCKGFVGVNTGTFCMATSMMNGNVLHLYKRHHFAPNYKRFNPVPEVDCRNIDNIDKNKIREYLCQLH